MFSKQAQTAGEGATSIQAGGHVVLIQGVSATEARQIALDVFEANFIKAHGAAMEIAKLRGQHITDQFVSKLEKEHPAGLNQAATPDFQDALFTVQKEYAKAGDEHLGDLLVDLLVDRTKHPQRDLMQLVLNESLHTAPKLTSGQINTLSVIFVLRYVGHNGTKNTSDLSAWWEQVLKPAVGEMATSMSTFQHLEFTGCGTTSVTTVSLEQAWADQYQGLFMKGFGKERLEWANFRPELARRIVMPCLWDPEKFQIAALNRRVIADKLNAVPDVSDEERGRIETLYGEGSMDHAALKEKLLTEIPWMASVSEAWPKSGLGRFQLTSVGMAIAHANIKRVAGEFAPLTIWINEESTAKA